MADPSSEEDEKPTLVQKAVSRALVPVQLATSRPAIKAYLSTILFLSASFVLFALSTTAYIFFYYSYIPQINLSRVIHLQYHTGTYPYSITALDTSALISQQPYDITIHLHLPRTPSNLAAGNFMLDLALLTRSDNPISSILNNATSMLPYNILISSRRPAILPYNSPLLGLASTLSFLPLHLLSVRDLDAHTLNIPMMELYSFPRGSRNVPSAIRFELQSQVPLQVYSASISFRARFEGLRYVIYNFRILSFLAFSSVFYICSVSSMGFAWLVISAIFGSTKRPSPKIKKEPDLRIKSEPEDEEDEGNNQLSNGRIKSEHPQHSSDQSKRRKGRDAKKSGDPADTDSDEFGLSLSNLSDTATTFPTLGRQMPLRFPIPSSRTGSDSAQGLTGGVGGEPSSTRSRVAGDKSILAETQIEPLVPVSGGLGQGTDDVADDEEDEEEEEDDHLQGPLPAGTMSDRGRQGDRAWDDFRDSGIGTSMESENVTTGTGGAASSGLTRRRSGRQSRGAGNNNHHHPGSSNGGSASASASGSRTRQP